jgi:hypothetical protein
MCGDLEEEDRLEGDLYQRFLVHSQAMQEQRPSSSQSPGSDLNRYLDGLFQDLLKRCTQDAEQTASPGGNNTGYKTLAMQSLVFARLAGFLAGHVALNEDPMRKLMEAMMHGYQEAENPPERNHHGPGDHHHHDGHGHGHDHAQAHANAHDHQHDHGKGHGHDHGHDHSHGHSQGRGH